MLTVFKVAVFKILKMFTANSSEPQSTPRSGTGDSTTNDQNVESTLRSSTKSGTTNDAEAQNTLEPNSTDPRSNDSPTIRSSAILAITMIIAVSC